MKMNSKSAYLVLSLLLPLFLSASVSHAETGEEHASRIKRAREAREAAAAGKKSLKFQGKTSTGKREAVYVKQPAHKPKPKRFNNHTDRISKKQKSNRED